MKYYLAINYGVYEGWSLKPFETAQEALEEVKGGQTFGSEWKILKELDIKIEEETE